MAKNKANKKLKALRALKGISQEDMAKMLGMTRVSFQQKENGKRQFTADEINKILAVCDTKYEDVFI